MMKKVIFALLLMQLALGQVFAGPCGDVNSDGKVNIIDALLLAQFYVGSNSQSFDKSTADVNGDSQVNIVDALLVAQYYVGLINTFQGCQSEITPTPENTDPGPEGPMLPPNGAKNVSADITLGIVIKGTPKLSGSGSLKLKNSSGKVIETFKNTKPVSRKIAGKSYKIPPIQIIGNRVYFLLKSPLKYGETYSVTVDKGMVSDDKGNQFSASGKDWSFTVRDSKPLNSSTITIASDGSGDYGTIQGALDELSPHSSTTRVLKIKNGDYPGLVVVKKSNIKFQGTDRFKTILANKNSARIAPSRETIDRMAYLIKANDITFDSLTLWNTFPFDGRDGRQAEAIVVDKNVKRIFINNCEVKSFQDTIMVYDNGQLYIKDSRIWGDIHFLWGYGSIYCEDSELTTHKGASSITVARNGADTMGFAFVNCKLTRVDTDKPSTLGDTHGFKDGNVAFINCQIDDHISGWKNVSNRDWEYGNTKLSDGSPVKFNGIQLTKDSQELAKAASAKSWLGWSP